MQKSAQMTFCNFLHTIIIIVGSVALFYFMQGFWADCFLADDNLMQQEPIINASFNRLLETGKLPYIDFYQYKKFDTISEGIYSLCNPLMFIAYLISSFIFHRHIATISVYIYIVVTLGNLAVYYLLKEYNIRRTIIYIVIVAYMGTSAFIMYGYYYFVFTNYFIIPFLLLIILKSYNHRILKYIASGSVLAFSILLGHIQFSVYYFMVYVIVMCFLLFKDGIRGCLIMISNILIGIIISIPQLYMLLLSSQSRAEIFSVTTDFLSRAVDEKDFFLNSFVPLFSVKTIRDNVPGWMDVDVFYTMSTHNIFMGILLPLCILFFMYLIYQICKIIKESTKSKRKHVCSINQIIVIGSFFAMAFFVLFSFGESGRVAVILSKLPLISQFRYLYKCIVIFIPLMVLPAAFILNKILSNLQHKKYMEYLIYSFCLIINILGICNNYYITSSGVHDYVNNSRYEYNNKAIDYNQAIENRLKELQLDTENYRFLSIIYGRDVSEFIENSSSQCFERLTKNISTVFGCFTLMGYTNSFSKETFMQSDLIMTDMTLNGQYTNAIWGECPFNNVSASGADSEYAQNYLKQFSKNAVKYILVDTDDSLSIDAVHRFADTFSDLSIKREVPFVGNTILIELEGSSSIAIDETGKKINVTSHIDELVLETDWSSKKITVSMTYDPHYIAFFADSNGNKHMLNVSKDDDGFTVIDTENCTALVHLGYVNHMYDCAVVVAFFCIILLMSIIMLFYKDAIIHFYHFVISVSFGRFLITGGGSTLIDFVLYMFFSVYWPIYITKAFSMIIAGIFSYFANKYWTFKKTMHVSPLEVTKYIICQMLNISINVSVNYIIYILSRNKILAFIIATILAMIANFILQRFIVFSQRKKEQR